MVRIQSTPFFYILHIAISLIITGLFLFSPNVYPAESQTTASNSTAEAEQTNTSANNSSHPPAQFEKDKTSPQTNQQHAIEKTEDSGFFSFLDEPHEGLSTGIESLSAGMDQFFTNEKFYRETTSSYVRVRADMVLREPSDISTIGDIRIRLDLPLTRKKLKLIIESDPQETDSTDNIATQTVKKEEDKDYFIGLEKKEKVKGQWKIRPSIGVRARQPLDFYVRLRFLRDYDLSHWKLRFNETLYWFDSIGYGADTFIDLDRKINDDLFFRASSNANWSDQNDYFFLGQFFSLFHTLSERRATSYYVGVTGQSQPEIHATDYYIGFRYRQKIHKNWLFLEVNPQIQYPKNEDFTPKHTLLLRLEAFFGSQYL